MGSWPQTEAFLATVIPQHGSKLGSERHLGARLENLAQGALGSWEESELEPFSPCPLEAIHWFPLEVMYWFSLLDWRWENNAGICREHTKSWGREGLSRRCW